ncbi:haloacid dehalogenase type II [Oceanibaculum pacificum]|uniref:(S)-2-haloacid dehalogenase n=1 Tax=Oceanibaculum pacificum TaxID=580166 RepID=A0A154WBX2_9PROT|nr:haloacid dehalogenase type II [Oceanibaculum pacificum]KZD11009.1 haloacid dehalogenase [Oceanibaculum pacificum]
MGIEALAGVKALTYDVFGTVVDWRSSVTREGGEFGRAHGIDLDWQAFADEWRGLYQPSMEKVRSGQRPWARLDDLHRESLVALLEKKGVTGLPDDAIDHFNKAWHRLDPWPEAVAGLTRLKKRYILATMSNGNIALMVNMAKRAGLPWDVILGAEVARAYKPQPETYLRGAEALGLKPEECALVAAHNNDLHAAAKVGFKTVFVLRPTEHGPGQTKDLAAEPGIDLAVADFQDLADRLGC